jgi:hypothetical protein
VSASPLALYGRALHSGNLRLHDADGGELDVPLARWLGHAARGQQPLPVGRRRRGGRGGVDVATGFAVADGWRAGGRWFVELRRC